MLLRPEFRPDAPVEEEHDLDDLFEDDAKLAIRDYVQVAVRKNLKRKDLLIAICMLAETPFSTQKMQQFFPVATEYNLSRNEILVWMHIASGGFSGSEGY